MDARGEVIGECKLRVERDRAFEQGQPLGPVLLWVADPAPAKEFARADVEIVGLEIPRRRRLQARHLPWREIGLERPHDPLRQLALDREQVGQFTVESLGPDVGVGPGIDQLGVHPHPVPGAAHRAFENVRDAERFPDLAQVADAAPVLLDRGAADHLQVGDARQAGENVVMHAIGKKGVLAVIAQVFKRQHRDAFLGHLHRGARRNWRGAGQVLRALDPRGREVIGPGEDDRDRKPKAEREDN